MELTIQETDLLMSIRNRYVNMTIRFMPIIAEFDQLCAFITELHSIHTSERKIVMHRVAQVREAKDVADESHCNPRRFFKYKNTFGEFKRVWHEIDSAIFTKEARLKLAEAYAKKPLIARIDVGYHINRTGKERGADLLALFDTSATATRITFADGSILDIPSLEQHDLLNAQETYYDKMHPKMVPVI